MPEVNETHVWLLRLNLTPEQLSEAAALLSADERARASAFRAERDRTRYVAAHAHLRRLLGRHARVEPAALLLGRNEHRKPRLLTAAPGPYFNLSSSGDICAVAITDCSPVGVDVERQAPIDIDSLVVHCSPSERCWLATLPADERLRGFYRCWTLKEAVLKASGQGLSVVLSRVSVISESGQVAIHVGPEVADGYHAVELVTPVGYSAALALCGTPHSIVVLHSELT